MRKSKAVIPMLFFSMLLSIGCKKDVSIDSIMMMEEEKIQSSGISQQVKEKLYQLQASLPVGYEKRLEKIARLSSHVNPWLHETGDLMNVSPTPCEGLNEPNKLWWMGALPNTLLWQWLNEQLSDWISRNTQVIR